MIKWLQDVGSVSEREMLESWVKANMISGALPASLAQILNKKKPYALRRWLEENRLPGDQETRKAAHAMLDRLRRIWREDMQQVNEDKLAELAEN